MNLLPLLIGFMLMNGFKKNKEKTHGGLGGLGNIFSNPDAMGLIPHITKLFDSNASEEDKSAAMMALMSNPAMFELLQKFTSKKTDGGDENNNDAPENDGVPKSDGEEEKDKSVFQTSNGTESKTEETSRAKFSTESREFFRPVENVAGVEISQKLYNLYDNWYIKK